MPTREQELQKAQQELDKWFLGKTSKHYESGRSGPGTISSGAGDHGGVSYGSYQLSTNMGTLKDYLIYSNNYNHAFDGLKPKTEAFNHKWKELANTDPRFHQSQHDFVASSHYRPLLQVLKEKENIDFSGRGKAIQDMVWSTAVQYGINSQKIMRARDESDLNFNTATDAEIITAVQDSKLRHYKQDFRSSSPQVQEGIRKRIIAEKADLLRLDGYEKLIEREKHEPEKDKSPQRDVQSSRPMSKYDETMAMLEGLLNDTDGSYAKKVLAEHPEEVARFNEKVEAVRLERQQELQQQAELDNDREIQLQHEQQRGFSRSL